MTFEKEKTNKTIELRDSCPWALDPWLAGRGSSQNPHFRPRKIHNSRYICLVGKPSGGILQNFIGFQSRTLLENSIDEKTNYDFFNYFLFLFSLVFFCSTRRPNNVLNGVKITHMDSQTSDNDRSNTQMMLPDAFLIISNHFVKFCDFPMFFFRPPRLVPMGPRHLAGRSGILPKSTFSTKKNS